MSILSLKFRSKSNWGLQIVVRELEIKEAMLNLESNRNPPNSNTLHVALLEKKQSLFSNFSTRVLAA